MEYTKLGNTGLDVSRICLGCMGFGDAEILVVVGEVRLDVEVRLFAQAATGEIQRRILGEGGGNEEAPEREKKQKDRVKIPRIRII